MQTRFDFRLKVWYLLLKGKIVYLGKKLRGEMLFTLITFVETLKKKKSKGFLRYKSNAELRVKEERRRMRERDKLNAIRSGIVVIGFLAFGYLSLELGFKPFLLKAQQLQEQQQNKSASGSGSSTQNNPSS